MFLLMSVCLSLCLSVCPLDYWKSYEQILMKFFGRVGHAPRNNPLDFGGDPDNNSDPGIFKVFFFYRCSSIDSQE